MGKADRDTRNLGNDTGGSLRTFNSLHDIFYDLICCYEIKMQLSNMVAITKALLVTPY